MISGKTQTLLQNLRVIDRGKQRREVKSRLNSLRKIAPSKRNKKAKRTVKVKVKKTF